MRHYKIEKISTLKNKGQAAEQDFAYYVTGKMVKPDHHDFMGEDDVAGGYSVKSARFTLCRGCLVSGTTVEDQFKDFASKVHSDKFVYVTADRDCYEMNLVEFRAFVFQFCKMDKESTGELKVRMCHETKKVLQYLECRAF